MTTRRIVGIDLGIASAHTVRVLDETGTTLAKRKAHPTVESLTEVERAALADCPEGTRLEVIVEPTGPAWPPIAGSFLRLGPAASRVLQPQRHKPPTLIPRTTPTHQPP